MKAREFVYIFIISFLLFTTLKIYNQKKEADQKIKLLTWDIDNIEQNYSNDMMLLQEFQKAMNIVVQKYPGAAKDFSNVMDSINMYGTTENE